MYQLWRKCQGKIKNDNMANDKFYNFYLITFLIWKKWWRMMLLFMCFMQIQKAWILEKLLMMQVFIYLDAVYGKSHLLYLESPYQWQHEPCLYGWKKKHQWYSGRKRNNHMGVWKNKEKYWPSNCKPIPLLAYPITNSSMSNTLMPSHLEKWKYHLLLVNKQTVLVTP